MLPAAQGMLPTPIRTSLQLSPTAALEASVLDTHSPMRAILKQAEAAKKSGQPVGKEMFRHIGFVHGGELLPGEGSPRLH